MKPRPVLLIALLVSLSLGIAAVGPLPSVLAAEACPNEQLRSEQPYGLRLPDCRAYEMVSPLVKNGAGASYVDSRASVSGEVVTYLSPGAFAEPLSTVLESRYVARRGASGWSSENVSPPYTDYRAIALHNPPFGQSLFTPDLSSGILTSLYTPLLAGEPAGYVNIYAADTEDGSYRTVTDVTPEAEYKPFIEGSFDQGPQPEGASTDLGRVVFQQRASLCCGASPGRGHVYEWEAGRLSLVDVPPEGAKPFQLEDDVGSTANFNEPAVSGNPWHAVSDDGSRVFFTGADVNEIFGQLYVRENPTSTVAGCGAPEGACTVEVSASQRSVPDPHGPQPAFYRDASVDGSRVFFTSRAELTDDANTGIVDEAGNLYEYNLETGVLSDLSVDPGAPGGAAVVGLITASEDGSYVYFVANGVLASGAKEGNCRLEHGEGTLVGGRTCNLYMEHDGPGGWEAPRFIATLAGSNLHQFTLEHESINGDEADWIGEETENEDFGPGRHTARVSADGTRLAFQSELSLTGYDNQAAQPGQCSETGGCREVYLYDAVTGKLACVSCDPTGAQPTGNAQLGGHETEQGSFTQVEPFYLPRNLSEDGGRLFFQSPNPLVAQDSNGLLDVYEWEQPGEGSCSEAAATFSTMTGGCVFPVSDVAGSHESHFMDASANGDDVFIDTADQLLPSDTDSRGDVYDVRSDGGFPVSVAVSPCVNADSCKPPVSPQPEVFGVPASATFSGPGNATPAATIPTPSPVVVKPKETRKTVRCGKGEVRKHDRCVRKRKSRAGKSAHASRREGS